MFYHHHHHHHNHNHYYCIFRHGRLFWHDLIPETEIWLKIGGDKGGGSFKMAFEIANTKNPNAKCNTVVFSAFEAPDNASNIKLALGRYLCDVEQLCITKWRYKAIYLTVLVLSYKIVLLWYLKLCLYKICE